MNKLSPNACLKLDNLEILQEQENKKTLIDGSILIEEDYCTYTRHYADGKIAEYQTDYLNNDNETLFLMKEQFSDGSLAIYDYKEEYDEETDEEKYTQVEIYKRDAKGNYTFNRYEKDDYYGTLGDLLETSKGNVYNEQAIADHIALDDLDVVYEKGNEKILINGAVLTSDDDNDTYTCHYINGKIAEYDLKDDDLFLTKEQLPDGTLTIYGYKEEYDEETDEEKYTQVEIYKRDAKGNYTFNRYEKDDYYGTLGDLLETIKGNIYQEQAIADHIALDDLDVVYEKDYEKILMNGAILTIDDDTYTCHFVSGKIAEYDLKDDELFLIKEQNPDGSLTIYDYKEEYDEETDEEYTQVEIYKRDAKGNYTFNRYEKDDYYNEIGDLLETIKGNIYQEQTTEAHIALDDLNIIYEKGNKKTLIDGSILTEDTYNTYTRRYPNGNTKEYYLDDEDVGLLLTKETFPDGRIVTYGYKKEYNKDEHKNIYTPIKLYEKDADDYYISHQYDKDYYGDIANLVETIEGIGTQWTKKTFYDENENPIYYQKDGDETKKYYPSDVLMEEITEDGSVFTYYENSVCKSETHPNGVVKEYAPNKMVLYQKDEEANYQKFKLNRHGDDTLLLEKGTRSGFTEKYEYDDEDNILEKTTHTSKGILIQMFYPGPEQKIKKEMLSDGTIIEWNKNGKKTDEYLPDGRHKKFLKDKYYQCFDKNDNLIEETSVFGRMTYSYYPGTKQLKQVCKFNESNQPIISGYRHYDPQGNDNTRYYLARISIIKERIAKEDAEAERKGIDRIKAMKKRSKIAAIRKAHKYLEHIKAMKKIKER